MEELYKCHYCLTSRTGTHTSVPVGGGVVIKYFAKEQAVPSPTPRKVFWYFFLLPLVPGDARHGQRQGLGQTKRSNGRFAP